MSSALWLSLCVSVLVCLCAPPGLLCFLSSLSLFALGANNFGPSLGLVLIEQSIFSPVIPPRIFTSSRQKSAGRHKFTFSLSPLLFCLFPLGELCAPLPAPSNRVWPSGRPAELAATTCKWWPASERARAAINWAHCVFVFGTFPFIGPTFEPTLEHCRAT